MSEASPAPGTAESAETPVSTESGVQPGSQDVTAASSTATQDASRESSPGQAEKPASMLDAVKAAVAKSAASPADGGQTDAAKAADGTDRPKDQESEEELPEDPTDEELARYHSKTRRRVQMLKTQRDEARTKLKEAEPAIEGWNRIVSFAQESKLSGQEMNAGLEIMAAMKADPFRALEMLEPYYRELARMAGKGDLPPDLQKAVDDGRIDESYAREVAAARTKATVADTRRQDVEQRSAAERAAQERAAATDHIRSAIGAWEQKWQQSDPDFKVKASRTLEKIELGFLKGNIRITTPQEAVAFAEKCRQEVENELKGFTPRRPAINPVTGVAATAGSRPKPTSMLEAMQQAAART